MVTASGSSAGKSPDQQRQERGGEPSLIPRRSAVMSAALPQLRDKSLSILISLAGRTAAGDLVNKVTTLRVQRPEAAGRNVEPTVRTSDKPVHRSGTRDSTSHLFSCTNQRVFIAGTMTHMCMI